ncbi:TPA: hypothetical protein EYP66_05225 [Candidatus Poribacteria bacterium]|nr:hypothetical protein [Candidatus Poribacteria bacterium]
MKRSTLMLLLFSVIGGTLILLNFQGLIGAEVEDQNRSLSDFGYRESAILRREWQQLAVWLAARAEREVEVDCCVVDPCTYCLLNKEDGRCTCASDLNTGKETCPECLGKWLNRQGSMHSWMGFRRVYPRLASWLATQGGPPASCPMMSGRGGSMGMRGMMGGPMGMMGRMTRWFGRRSRGISGLLKEKRIDLMMKSRELKLISEYNCCMAGGGSCAYCIQDRQSIAKTICDCKDRLKAGREVCPECLGVWASGEWNPELKKEFQRTYPLLSRLIPEKIEK